MSSSLARLMPFTIVTTYTKIDDSIVKIETVPSTFLVRNRSALYKLEDVFMGHVISGMKNVDINFHHSNSWFVQYYHYLIKSDLYPKMVALFNVKDVEKNRHRKYE